MSTLRTDTLQTTDSAVTIQIEDLVVQTPAVRAEMVVANVAAMLLVDPTSIQTVRTNGYTIAGDGGHGDYRADLTDVVTPSNGFTTHIGLGGVRWKLIHNGQASIRQAGAQGNWNGTVGADDTLAFQRAADSDVHEIIIDSVPAGFAYQTTSTINITKASSFVGRGVVPYTALSGVDGGTNTRGRGSWIHLNHSGKGFLINTGAGSGGPEFRSLGTLRTHATPSLAAFAATVADYDFEISNTVDVKFIDICLLNPYKGIYSHDSQTRMWVERLYGQPMKEGIRCEECFDIHRFNDVHFWPYWSQNTRTWTYTKSNLDAFLFGRCDGFMLSNVFSIFHNRGMLIYGSASGTANKLMATNLFLDQGRDGYVVDVTATGHTAMLSNLCLHGETGIVGDNYGLAVFADQVDLSISNANISNVNSYAIYIPGAFCNLGIHDVVFLDWGLSNVTLPAVNVVQNNCNVWIDGSKRFFSNAGNVASRYSSPGVVRTVVDRGVFAGTTNGSGDVTILFTGNVIPTSVNLTNLSSASITYSVINRTLSSVTVRLFNGTVPLTGTVVSIGWEVSI